ncbi:hypothetical protein D3C72_1793830 [compost metagenome]
MPLVPATDSSQRAPTISPDSVYGSRLLGRRASRVMPCSSLSSTAKPACTTRLARPVTPWLATFRYSSCWAWCRRISSAERMFLMQRPRGLRLCWVTLRYHDWAISPSGRMLRSGK